MKTKSQNKKNSSGAPAAKIPVYEKPGASRQRAAAPDSSRIEAMKVEPLQRINFILMAVSAAIIVLGFLLMLGKGSTPEAFNPDIFSTRRIVVGPTIAFLGFIFMGAAIIYRPKNSVTTPTDTDESGHN